MLDHPLPIALAHWLHRRLADTLDTPLEDDRFYALDIIDPADMSVENMVVRSSYLGSMSDHTEHCRPDALALATRIWVPEPGHQRSRPVRPNDFAQRRAALVISTVCDTGTGTVLRHERRPSAPVELSAHEASGILVTLVDRWCELGDGRIGRGAA